MKTILLIISLLIIACSSPKEITTTISIPTMPEKNINTGRDSFRIDKSKPFRYPKPKDTVTCYYISR